MNPTIQKLTHLRDSAPSASFVFTNDKTLKPSTLASFANDMPLPHIEFQIGRCQYKVVNTWEHLDYLIRQHRRVNATKFANTPHTRYPAFRTRQAAEGGFTKASKTTAESIRTGDIIYPKNFGDTAGPPHICTSELPTHGTLILVNLESPTINGMELSQEDAHGKHSYVHKKPHWPIFHNEIIPPAGLRLIAQFNPPLFKQIQTLRAQSRIINSRIATTTEQAAA